MLTKLAIGAAALVALVFILGSREPSPSALAQLAVDECWKRYESKALSASEKQFIAGSCEELERRAKEKR